MSQNPYREDKEELRELIIQYQHLKHGRSHPFLDEDAFERIIDYYDEKDDLPEAMIAAELGLEQFPYSANLMIKKADLLLASRKYQEALNLLETAELFDSTDLNLFILKKDSLLNLYKKIPLAQIFADLWNLKEWYAKEFIKALEIRIGE